MRAVLCWDIDGTLLTTGRAGILAWEDAAKDVLHVALSLEGFHTAGLTDVEIAREIVSIARFAIDGNVVSALVHRYEDLLPSRLPLRAGRVLPGVREILAHVSERRDLPSLLLTGNTARGARAKLTHYALWSYFSGGAFAENGVDRVGIARRACEVARERFGDVPPDRTYVIGDTPLDIACGRAVGVRTIAVATGQYSVAELSRYDPWWVLERLPPPQEFADKLTVNY